MLRRRAVLVLFAALLAPAALASPWQSMGPARMHGAPQEERISLDQAVAKVERRFHARAVRAQERREGDRVVYRIRLLSGDGRVFEVSVDAATGAVE